MYGDDSRLLGVKLDEIDEKLLWQLTSNGRLTNRDLAETAGIAPSTCHARLRRLENLGVLRSVNASVNYEAIGFHVQAMVSVRLHASARDQLKPYARQIVMHAQVLNVFFVGGPDDFLVHVACTSTAQLRDFVSQRLSQHPVAATNTSIMFDHFVGVQHMTHVDGYNEMRAPIAESTAGAPRRLV